MSQSEFTCGHFEQIPRETLEELFSEVAAVRAQNQELFEFTHRPITVYPSEEVGNSDPTTVTEEEVLAEFTEGGVQNQVTVIEGDTGTGKSELCAYLIHQLRDERPILRVHKDDDLMSILTKRLPEFHKEHLGKEMPNVADYERMERNIREYSRTVAKSATTDALLRFDRRNLDLSFSEWQEEEIIDIVEKQLKQLITKGEYGKNKDLITDQLFERKSCLDVFNGTISDSEALEEWNNGLWTAIREEYETPQLSEMLREIGEKFTDTRPVIVFEDFSIASIEARQLRNYMEDDPEDNWDFIVAGTRDVTEVLHTETANARFSFYQTNEPNSSSVLFLTEESAVEFIRPYLGYIKHHLGDGSLEYDRTNGELELLEPKAGSLCADCGLCSPAFRDLYPFTETFLSRLYAGLDDSEQSPRKYVTKVFNILDEYRSGAIQTPADSLELEGDVSNEISPSDTVYDKAEEYANLAKWYGVRSGENFVVPGAFVKAFGLSPNQADVSGLEQRGEELLIPGSESEGEIGGSGPNSGTNGPADKSLVERRYDEHKGDVDNWRMDPSSDSHTKVNEYITAALTELIKHVTDDYRLWTDCDLRYNLSQNKTPYVLGNTTQKPNDDQIILDQREFRRSELRDLLKYGIRLKTDGAEPDRDSQLSEMGTQFVGYAREWRSRVRDTYIHSDRVLYRAGRSQYDFDDFVVASYAWLVMLSEPHKPLSAERLNEMYTSDTELELDQNLKQELEIQVSVEKRQELETLFEYAEYIEKLVGSRFGITSNALNLMDLRERLTTEPHEILSALAKTRIDNINSRIRFDSSAKLPGIATAFYNCCSTIAGVATDLEDRYGGVEQFITSNLRDVDMQEIAEIGEKLDAISNVDSDFNTAVQQFVNIDTDQIQQTVEAAAFTNTLRDRRLSTQKEIQLGLARMSLANSRVFGTLLQLNDEWAGPADTGDASYFLEVTNKYAN